MDIKRYKGVISQRRFQISILVLICILSFYFITPLRNSAYSIYDGARIFIQEHILSDTQKITVANTDMRVEVADTVSERAQGLSGKTQLPNRGGMLFVFEKADFHGFWMKDMNFAIDIIWFNEEKEIIYILHDIEPDTYPDTFLPPTKALYVLEVPAGFAKKEEWRIGDKIDL